MIEFRFAAVAVATGVLLLVAAIQSTSLLQQMAMAIYEDPAAPAETPLGQPPAAPANVTNATAPPAEPGAGAPATPLAEP